MRTRWSRCIPSMPSTAAYHADCALDLRDTLDPSREGHFGERIDAYHVWRDPALMPAIARAAGRILALHAATGLSNARSASGSRHDGRWRDRPSPAACGGRVGFTVPSAEIFSRLDWWAPRRRRHLTHLPRRARSRAAGVFTRPRGRAGVRTANAQRGVHRGDRARPARSRPDESVAPQVHAAGDGHGQSIVLDLMTQRSVTYVTRCSRRSRPIRPLKVTGSVFARTCARPSARIGAQVAAHTSSRWAVKKPENTMRFGIRGDIDAKRQQLRQDSQLRCEPRYVRRRRHRPEESDSSAISRHLPAAGEFHRATKCF